MERCVLFGAPGLAQPCRGEGSASDPALGSNPSSSRRWARNPSLSPRRPALEWRVRCTGRAPRVPAVGVTPFRPGGGCMGGPRGLAGLRGRAGPPASPVEFSNPLWRQRRRRLAAGRGAPLAPPPPPTPDRVSGAWHGGPICFQSGPPPSVPSSGLWPGLGGAFATGPPPPHPPVHPPPRPQPDSPGAGRLCARAPPPAVCAGGAASASQPGLGGAPAAPSTTSRIWVCWGAPCAVSGVQPLHPLPWPWSAAAREGGAAWGAPPLGSGSGGQGGLELCPLGAPPYVGGAPCAPWRPLPHPPSNKTPKEASRTPRWGSPRVPRPTSGRLRSPLPGPPPGRPAPGPAPGPSALGRGLSRVCCARSGRTRDGLQRAARGRAPTSEPRGECGRDPLAPRGPVCAALCPPPRPLQAPGRGDPRGSPPPPRARVPGPGPAALRGQTARARRCLAPPPPIFRLVARTLENSRPLCAAGSPPPLAPSPPSSPIPRGRSQAGQPSLPAPGALMGASHPSAGDQPPGGGGWTVGVGRG